MYCPNCGSELQDGAKFCSSCGAPVTAGAGAEEPEERESIDTSKLIRCPDCGQWMAKSAKRCPHCGSRKRHQWVMFFIGIVILWMLYRVYTAF